MKYPRKQPLLEFDNKQPMKWPIHENNPWLIEPTQSINLDIWCFSTNQLHNPTTSVISSNPRQEVLPDDPPTPLNQFQDLALKQKVESPCCWKHLASDWTTWSSLEPPRGPYGCNKITQFRVFPMCKSPSKLTWFSLTFIQRWGVYFLRVQWKTRIMTRFSPGRARDILLVILVPVHWILMRTPR